MVQTLRPGEGCDMTSAADTSFSYQSLIDAEHLKLLSLGYMISAGFSALFSLFGLFSVLMGAAIGTTLSHAVPINSNTDQLPPAFAGWIFAGIGLFIMGFAVAYAVFKLLAARNLKRRRSRVFCIVVAGFTCLEFPYGTALGVMTFIVLGRDSVVRLFESGAAPQPAPRL